MMYNYIVKILVILLVIHLAFMFIGISSKIILCLIVGVLLYPSIKYIKDKFFN